MVLDGPSSPYHFAVHQLFQIEGFFAVTIVSPRFDREFSSMVTKLFASLEYLRFYEMSNWKEWKIPVEKVGKLSPI